MEALDWLLERSSCPQLVTPAPAGEALQTILRCGLRAPDHGHLQPFEFLIAEGEGLRRLGDILAEAAKARGEPPAMIDKARQAPLRAPMVITVVARVQAHDKVPALEQELAAGCALLMMQMAAQASGFGGMWRSGWFMFDRGVHRALGLSETDQIVGFLYLGTPGNVQEKKPREVELARFVRRL